MRRKLLSTLALAAALAASPLAAQGHGNAMQSDSGAWMGPMHSGSGMMGGMMQMMHGMYGQSRMMPGMMGGGMMGAGMPGGMMTGPGMMLRLREFLDLTDGQVAQLEALRDSAGTEARQYMIQGMQAMHGAAALLAPSSTDLDAYAAQLGEAASEMVQARVAMARAGVAARDILTDDQRQRLATAREVMQSMGAGAMNGNAMGGGMHGGMIHGGVNGGMTGPDTSGSGGSSNPQG